MSHDVKGGAAPPGGAVRILYRYRLEHGVGQRVRIKWVPLSEPVEVVVVFGIIILATLAFFAVLHLVFHIVPEPGGG
jgi:hypothetical protein